MPKLLVVRNGPGFVNARKGFMLNSFWWGLFLPFSETVAKTGMILLAGEVTSHATVDYQKVVRETIRQIGYDDSRKGVCACMETFLPLKCLKMVV